MENRWLYQAQNVAKRAMEKQLNSSLEEGRTKEAVYGWQVRCWLPFPAVVCPPQYIVQLSLI